MPRKSRNTLQKELIQHEIDKIDDFFNAKKLYDIIKKKHEGIGIATIYRYLKALKKEKKLYSYICNKTSLYSKSKKSHCHFICEKSGKVIHFDVDSLDFLKNKIPGSITSFQIEVKGRCKECQKL